MNAKDLKDMIRNNKKLSMASFDELIEMADQKLSFFERIGEKGRLQKEIINNFDSIIDLLNEEARPNVLYTSVQNESIKEKILAYAMRFVSDSFSAEKGTGIDRKNLSKIFEIAYGEDFKESESKNKLVAFFEEDENRVKIFKNLYLGDFPLMIEEFRDESVRDKFVDIFKQHFDDYLKILDKYQGFDGGMVFNNNPQNTYRMLSGNLEKFYLKIKEKNGDISEIFKKMNFDYTFKENPEFKQEVFDFFEEYSKKEDYKDKRFFSWMCNIYTQTNNLEILAPDLEQLFNSRKEDGRFEILALDVSKYYFENRELEDDFKKEFLSIVHDRFLTNKLESNVDYEWFIDVAQRIDRQFMFKNLERIADLVPPHKVEDYLKIVASCPIPAEALDVLGKKARQLLEKTNCPISTRGLIEKIEKQLVGIVKDKKEYTKINKEELNDVMAERVNEIAFEIGERFQNDPKKIALLESLLNELMKNEHVSASDVKFLNSGSYSKVYQIGEKVLKIGREPEHYIIPKNHKRLIQPLIRRRDIFADSERRRFYIEISELCDMSKKPTREELYQVYKDLRESGLIWTDAFEGNVGLLKRPNKRYFNKIGEAKENGEVEWGSFTHADSSGGLGKNDDGVENQEILKEGQFVVIDLDYIFDENDPKIFWPKCRYSRDFEQQYQKEKSKGQKEIEK